MAGFVAVISVFLASLLANAVRAAYRSQTLPAGDPQREGPAAFARREGLELLDALEKGAKNAIMVSVACAAAGVIVGMVTLTGMGLKFSSLVLDLSFGIEVLGHPPHRGRLAGFGHGPAGDGLLHRPGHPGRAGPAWTWACRCLVTHMIVFWYSQDANVTPPVSLASFAGAGVAGANPMRTAFTSWKLAKGLYIIPIVMAYRPLLVWVRTTTCSTGR